MRLTQTELDRVLIFNVAEMARRRRGRQLQLNHPEAVGLLSDEMMELARGGASHAEVRAFAVDFYAEGDLLPGVAELLRGFAIECLFDDGARIIVIDNPVAAVVTPAEEAPGAVTYGDGEIELNVGRQAVSVVVHNTSDHVINISSHYHFHEVNPRLEFDRELARGRRLDIQAGRSVIWMPGETKSVQLVAFAGAGHVEGFQQNLRVTASGPAVGNDEEV